MVTVVLFDYRDLQKLFGLRLFLEQSSETTIAVVADYMIPQ